MEVLSFSTFANALDEDQADGLSFAGLNRKWTTKEDAKEVIEGIEKCESLTYLKLEGNSLGVEAAIGISDALKKRPEFKRSLWKDLFTGRLKDEIPVALKHLGNGMIAAGAQLTVFDCSDNALGPNGMVGLVGLLKSPACFSLQELRLNNCGLGIQGGKMLSRALLDGYEASVKSGRTFQLKTFVAGRNRLENDGAIALAEVFSTFRSLEHISMPQNGINPPGIAALSESFQLNGNMKILNLNDNTITARGAVSLSEALTGMDKLEEINFGDCLLKTKGAILLAESLQDGHDCLVTVDLSFNEIGPDGGLAIISAMENARNLTNLVMGGNHFGSDCQDEMYKMLEKHNREVPVQCSFDEDDSDGGSDEEDEYSGDEDDEDDEEHDETDEYVELDTDDVNPIGNYLDTVEMITPDTTIGVSDISILEPVANTVEGFCCATKPDEEIFVALPDKDKVDAFRSYLKTIPEDEYLLYLLFTILKCSSISTNQPEALDVAVALYKDCFEYAGKTNQLQKVRNFFLIQLGLLKTDDPKFKPIFDKPSCRSTLEHCLKMGNTIIPDEIRDHFRIFLDA